VTDIVVVTRRYAAAGIDLPEGAQRAVDLLAAADAAIRARPDEDLRADLAAGKLTVKNIGKAVEDAALRTAVRDGMQALRVDLAFDLDKAAQHAFRADYDRIVGLLSDRFDTAAAVIVDAVPHLAAGDLDDPAAILARGRDAASRYHAVVDAGTLLDKFAALLSAITTTLIDGRCFVSLTDTPTTATFGQVERAFTASKRRRWLALYSVAGVAPHLNTRTEVAALDAENTKAIEREHDQHRRPLVMR
jgi:hypothetical protein